MPSKRNYSFMATTGEMLSPSNNQCRGEGGQSGCHCLTSAPPSCASCTHLSMLPAEKKRSRSTTGGSRFPAGEPGQGQVAQSHATGMHPRAGGQQRVTTCSAGFGHVFFQTMWKRKIVCTKKNPKNNKKAITSCVIAKFSAKHSCR